VKEGQVLLDRVRDRARLQAQKQGLEIQIDRLKPPVADPPPSQQIPEFNDYGCRNFNNEIEEEANWLGPALLVSEEAAMYIVKQRMNESTAAQWYGCTTSVIRFRLNMTGAFKRARH